jgi:hypothetical protein
MPVERKCTQCGTWNGAEDRCTNCDNPISPELIEEIREEKREAIRNAKEPTWLDHFLIGWKHHRFFLVKASYYVIYTIAFIFFSIAAFFAWLAASPNG